VRHASKLFIALSVACLSSAPAIADGGLSFIIDGDTFNQPYTISNISTAGETVVGFGLDLSPTNHGFDTVEGGPPLPNVSQGAQPFAAFGGTGGTVGLIGSPVVADGATSFGITFNDFQVGETFQFLIDVDPISNSASGNFTVLGSNLIGSTGYADFSNGLRGLGVFDAVAGNSDAAQFNIRTFITTPPDGAVPEPATWAMMIGGFGMVGGALRSIHAKARRATA
jgi:hypothetical protein